MLLMRCCIENFINKEKDFLLLEKIFARGCLESLESYEKKISVDAKEIALNPRALVTQQ